MTEERWLHIVIGHPEVADYYYEILEAIESPDIIYEGVNDAKIAVKEVQETFSKFVIAIYKETSAKDGFIITAHFTKEKLKFKNKKVIWKRQI